MRIIITIILLQTVINLTNGTPDTEYFERARWSKAFVDKSLFLKELITESSKYLLITCPRRFGKTVNLDMTRKFFQLPVNKQDGTLIDKKLTENYRLFADEILTMKIADDKFFEEHFGEYPVIYLCFTHAKGNSCEEIIEKMIEILIEDFRSYEWFYEMLRERNDEKNASYNHEWNLFQKIIHEKPTTNDMANGLYLLVKHISEFFGKQVVVLFNKYDFPITYAMTIDADIKDIIEFIDSILYAFTRAFNYVKFALVSGVSQMRRASRSCKTYIHPYQCFDDHRFAEYHGILENELDAVLRKQCVDEEERYKIKEFYNGYEIRNRNISLFNPMNIRQYFFTNRVDKHWINTQKRTLIYDFLNHQVILQAMLSLLSVRRVNFQLTTNVSLEELEMFAEMSRSMTNRRFRVTERHLNFHLTDLFEQGYFSFTEGENVFRIPNLEIEGEFRRDFKDFFSRSFCLDISNSVLVHRLRPLVKHENTTEEMLINLTESLNELFTHEVKLRIEKEFHFKALIFALIYYTCNNRGEIRARKIDDQSQIKSTGPGRSDILLQSDDEKIMLIVQVELGGDTSHVIKVLQRATKYVPFEPQKTSKIKIVKYLAINMNALQEIKVQAGENRHTW